MAETSLRAANTQPAGPALVGFSGGLDSTVLLHRLSAQAAIRERGLRAIHVQHGLHPDADAWAEHCQRVCDSLGIDLVVVEVRVASGSGLGPEAAAREVRHEAFAKQLRGGETLLLAHHQDDQAETVLLRLMRASGSQGLAAMRALRPFAKGWLWRPLLHVPRSALLEYAKAHSLRWIEDPSNSDQSLDRNFLRHRVLPTLRERWPHANTVLARSAELLAEDAALLRDESRKRLDQARGPDATTLTVTALLELERPWRTRVLRQWLSELRLPALPGNAFAIIDSDLLGARPDASAEYRWAGAVLGRWRDWLHVETQCAMLPLDWRCSWDGRGSLQLPTGDALFFASTLAASDALASGAGATGDAPVEACLGRLFVCARRGGERISLPGRSHSHALKHCLQEAGVPPWQRQRLPLLLAEDGELLAAGDQIVSARLEQFCRKKSVRLQWQQASRSPDI